MIHIKDSPLPRGKVWYLDFLRHHDVRFVVFFFPWPGAHGEATIYLDLLLWLHCHLSLCDSQLGTLAHSGGFNKNPKQKSPGHMKYIEETMGWLFF